ncbi:DNA/RNA non-specific endonuclease [Nocardiopsis sp. YSL2]|uniref:DNA/RNA non-specific endonuclease n=1 Tax=Nocardiopsis sp. YSL2 TaxID=2939492 RepID=UPI0026F45BC5|nr:DNA/RNA non-specific endonuclease [Nocardiopsis sp. YSL2]
MSESALNDPFLNDLGASACYGDGAINPSQIPVPRIDADELEGLGQSIRTAGAGIAESGGDIVSAWGGLSGIYEAPESETLLAAVNPVGTKGDDIEPAAATTGDALIAFAERVRELKPRLSGLRADAVELRTRINADEDWRKDEDLHEEHETLLSDVNAAVAEYQEAERECANAITALYGGPTFLAADALGGRAPGDDEIPYGFEEVPEGAAMPWGTSQDFDHPWYVDAWDGGADLVTGFAQDLGGLTGVWHDGQWAWSYFEQDGRDNFSGYMEENLEGLSLLTGFYDPTKPEGDQWGVDSVDEWWGNFAPVAYEVGQGIVPTDEWDDRPGYVITQGVINVGSIVGGVVLTATGIGAPVGVPLVLSRLQTGFRAINVLGSDSPSIPGNVDVESSQTPDLGRVDIGGSSSSPDGTAVPDDGGILPSPSTFDGMNESLESLHTNNASGSDASGSPDTGGEAPEQAGADTADGSRGGTDASDSSGDAESLETAETPDTRGSDESTAQEQDRADGQDTAGERDEVDTQATPADVERMLQEVDEYTAQHAGDLDAQAQVHQSRWDTEGVGADSRVREMAVAHGGDGPSALTNDTVTNSTGGSGGGPVDTPGGGSGDLRVDSSSGSGGGVTTGHGGTLGLGGNGHGGGPSGDLTGGSPSGGSSSNDRPPTIGDPEPISDTDPRFPEERERFGEGVTLDPNKAYVVDGRGTFITDDTGKIIHIETQPGSTRQGNPELVHPREDATYKITHPRSGAEYTYRTDHEGRTVSVEGDLRSGYSVRGAEQTAIGGEGRDYFRDLNNDPTESHTYETVDWNGGHLISGSEMGGTGERLNVIPMLKDLNQQRGTDFTNNYRRLELLWDGLVSGNDAKLKSSFSKIQPDSARDLVIQQWKDKVANGPQPPNIRIKITNVFDPDMKSRNGIQAPPSDMIIEWSLNGEKMDPITYENHPESRPR